MVLPGDNENPQTAFFLRTCPALAVGFVLKDEQLTTKHEELLKNLCSGEKNVYLKVRIIDRKKNDLYSVGDIFINGVSLVHLDHSAEVVAAVELSPTDKLSSVDENNSSVSFFNI
ncbi:unnamed protein product [Onchocerca flexuosa]|uniref:PDZ_3 domain-containing protein n=1 Tax=Onchocerca flexuosa TaxID=387005 RepID=A0A183HMR8_9BILA|nr:unnamed protein product [Onchocerca flexuosa]